MLIDACKKVRVKTRTSGSSRKCEWKRVSASENTCKWKWARVRVETRASVIVAWLVLVRFLECGSRFSSVLCVSEAWFVFLECGYRRLLQHDDDSKAIVPGKPNG